MGGASLWLATNDDGTPEIFTSIQGEGPCAGQRRTFIRLSGCNLHCRWCDTAYTWNWTGTGFEHEDDRPGQPAKFDIETDRMSLTLDEAVVQATETHAPGFVITGGEPLLQQTSLVGLVEALKAKTFNAFVEVETNGSIAPFDALAAIADQFNVSPKLQHSGNDRNVALKADRLGSFVDLPQAVFKFVVATPEDLMDIQDLADTLAIAPHRIWLMPLGRDSESIRARLAWLAPLALDRGYNLTDRQHIHLFGDTRGT